MAKTTPCVPREVAVVAVDNPTGGKVQRVQGGPRIKSVCQLVELWMIYFSNFVHCLLILCPCHAGAPLFCALEHQQQQQLLLLLQLLDQLQPMNHPNRIRLCVCLVHRVIINQNEKTEQNEPNSNFPRPPRDLYLGCRRPI